MAEDFFKELSSDSPHLDFKIEKLLDDISHELVHAQLEEEHGSTHNRDFSLRQRQILIELSKRINKQDLIQEVIKIYNDCIPNPKTASWGMLDWKLLLSTQFLNDTNSASARALYSLFPNHQPTAKPEVKPEPMQIESNFSFRT